MREGRAKNRQAHGRQQGEATNVYGTRLVWNSVISTLSAPSKRSDAVSDEQTCATRRLRFVYVGRSMSR